MYGASTTQAAGKVKRMIYRYPLWLRLPLELFGYGISLVAAYNFLRHIMFYLVVTRPLGIDPRRISTISWLPKPVADFFASVTNYFFVESGTEGLLWPLIQSIFALLLALLLLRFVRGLLPNLHVSSEGLVLINWRSERLLPWGELMRLHSTELSGGKYFIIVVEGSDDSLGLVHRLYSYLFGPFEGPSFLITSNIKNFDDLIQQIVSYRMSSNSPARTSRGRAATPMSAGLLIEEDYLLPAISVPANPQRALARLTGLNPGGKTGAVEDPESGKALEESAISDALPPPPPRYHYSRGQVVQQAAVLAAMPALIYLVDTLLWGFSQNRGFELNNIGVLLNLFVVRPLILLILGLLEVPIAAGVIYALGEILTGESSARYFTISASVYPFTQALRVLLLTLGLILLVANLGFFLVLLWLGGVVAGAYFAGLLTARLYPIDRQLALLGGAATIVYQLILLSVFGSFHN